MTENYGIMTKTYAILHDDRKYTAEVFTVPPERRKNRKILSMTTEITPQRCLLSPIGSVSDKKRTHGTSGTICEIALAVNSLSEKDN